MHTTDEKRRFHPKPRPNYKFDKQLINVGATVNNSQSNTSLFSATYPCVLMGLIVEGGSVTVAAAAQTITWYVHVVEQGVNIPVIAYGGSAFQPEQQVMCFGTAMIVNNVGAYFSKKTKTGRKMKAGDQLYFSFASNVAQTANYDFTIQFFLKI